MKSKYIKKFTYYPLCIFLLLLGLYLTITSNIFLSKVVAPVVGFLIESDFTVKRAKYDLFSSHLEIYDVKVGKKDNPFISAKSASGYIDIFYLFKNTLKLSEVCVDGIDLNFVKDRRGRWSLPWLYTNSSDDYHSKFILDFTDVNVFNLNLNFKDSLNESPIYIKLNNLKLGAERFKNGLLSLIKYNGNLKLELGKIVDVSRGDIKGELSVNLDDNCIPSHVNMSTHFSDLIGNIDNTRIANRKISFKTNIKRQEDGYHAYDIMSKGTLLLSNINFTVGNYQFADDVPLDLFVDYKLNLDFNKKTVSVKNLNSTLSVGNEDLFSLSLDKSFILNYGIRRFLHAEASPVIDINFKNLDLKLLNIFMKKNVRFFSGKLNSNLALSIDSYNSDISFNGNTIVEDLSFEINNCKPTDFKKDQTLNFNIKNDINFNVSGLNKFCINDFKFIARQPKNDVESIFILKAPFSFEHKQNMLVLDKDIKVELAVNKFHITDIVEYIPKSFPIKLNDGYLRYKYLFTVPKTLDSLNVNGQVELLYSNFSFYGKPVNNLSILNKINAVFYDIDTVKVKDCVTELYINGVLGFLAKTTGKIAINEKKNTNLTVSIKNFNKYFFDLFCNGISKNITKLCGNGKIVFDYTESDRTTSVKGDFNLSDTVLGSKLDLQNLSGISGGLKFNIVETDDYINIDKFDLSLMKEDVKVVKLNINGLFPVPIKKGMSNLTIDSDSIALDKIVDMCAILSQDSVASMPELTEEYDPIDFKGLDLKCDISLNDIFCGDLIKSSYYGKLDVKNNKVSLLNKSLKVNGTDVKFHGEVNTGYSNGYPYSLKTEFNNLDLNPIIETFIVGKYQKTKGLVDSFSLSFQGKGFSKENLKKNLNGNLDIMLSKLSLPHQIGQYKLLYIMLMPFEILVKLREMLPGGLLIKNLKKGVESAKKIFANKII